MRGVGGVIRVFDVATWSEVSPDHGHGGLIVDLRVSRDGRTATTAAQGTIRQWDLSDGRQQHRLDVARPRAVGVDDASGDVLAIDGEQVARWKRDGSESPRVLTEVRALSGDGRLAMRQQRPSDDDPHPMVHIVDVEMGATLLEYPPNSPYVQAAFADAAPVVVLRDGDAQQNLVVTNIGTDVTWTAEGTRPTNVLAISATSPKPCPN